MNYYGLIYPIIIKFEYGNYFYDDEYNMEWFNLWSELSNHKSI